MCDPAASITSMEEISCSICGRKFSHKTNLCTHMKNFHPDIKYKTFYKHICSVCSEKCSNMKELHTHIERQHEDIKLSFEKITFYCDSDFQEWKREHERESNCFFVFKSSTSSNGKTIKYFQCHRSGEAKFKTHNRKRSVKCSGSIKMNSTCPAWMKISSLTVNEATEIKVDFQSTHVGHAMEVRKLYLTKPEKMELANMLQSGIPTSEVLETVRETHSPSSRLGLINRKDLNNIRHDFKIDQKVIHEDEAISVDIKVKKLKEYENSILLYKPMGEIMANYPEIENDEFLLGIMNNAQLKLLELYGQNCVMIDSIQVTNKNGFHLTTIMVNDENCEGFPTAILYSTKTTMETFIPFFTEIKNRLPGLRPKILLSDDAEAFYNAWKKVFGDVSNHLLCDWHVIGNWNKNLNSKIKNSELRSFIRNELKAILHETCQITFEKLCNCFIDTYEDLEETKDFIKYFLEYYMIRAEKWAYCYTLKFGVNTNMKLEKWHQQIKYEESGGPIIKRLDKSLGVVLGAIRNKLMNRIISIEDELTSKKSDILECHSKAYSMDNYSFIENEDNKSWIIIKAGKNLIKTYTVNYETDCGCNIKCEKCSICIHTLSCTCIEYCIKYVICKHIHFVCIRANFCRTKVICPNRNMKNINEEQLANENKHEGKLANVKGIRKSAIDINRKKASLLHRLQKIQKFIQETQSLENLLFLEDNFSDAEMYCYSDKEQPSFSETPTSEELYTKKIKKWKHL